jgi:hypothetical protein
LAGWLVILLPFWNLIERRPFDFSWTHETQNVIKMKCLKSMDGIEEAPEIYGILAGIDALSSYLFNVFAH